LNVTEASVIVPIELPGASVPPALIVVAPSVPLPPRVPAVQVMEAPVRLIVAVPPSVPPASASVGIDCAAALFTAKVPAVSVSGVVMVPANVLVPFCTASVPVPEIVEAASNDDDDV
jgi:hypothetical protein